MARNFFSRFARPRPSLNPEHQGESPRRRMTIFDGQELKKAVLAGHAWLERHREAINNLNVFPVPDGDTGTNMSLTMRAATKEISDADDTAACVIAEKLSRGALMGARGNSGVILSQILRGLSNGLGDKATLTAADFATAMQAAARAAYQAVKTPIEGTILTVVREAAEAAHQSATRGADLATLFDDTVKAAKATVARTPDLLPKLKESGVVDAGGMGLTTILEGMSRYLRGDSIELFPREASATTAEHFHKGNVQIEEEFGYEVVFMLHGENLDIDRIRDTITAMGGVSTVVAGDSKLLKLHTHTPTPGKILDYGVSLGSLEDINIENLQEQSLNYAAESAAEHAAEEEDRTESETTRIATVAVVSGAGFEKVFQGLKVSAIVPGGQTMNPSIEELLSAVESVAAQQVIILPNNGNVIMSAEQVSGLTQKEVCVVPTKTLCQGIAALLGFNYEADFAINCKTMTEAARHIQTEEITTAVRSAQIGGVHVREGDYIGVINGDLAVAGQNMDLVIQDTLQRMHIDNYEIVTLYYGQDVNTEQAQEIARRIKQAHSHLEIEVVNGGQPYYAYIFSAE